MTIQRYRLNPVAWLFMRAKAAVNSYRAKRRAEKDAELKLKEIQNAYLKSFIHSRMEQYKKENNIVE